jgi:hypothetical protein
VLALPVLHVTSAEEGASEDVDELAPSAAAPGDGSRHLTGSVEAAG